MHLALYLIREREHRTLLDRAKLRALEQQTGQSTDDDGSYWLARTCALEKVASYAERFLRYGDEQSRDELAGFLAELDQIPAPACRPGDHQVAA